MIRKVRPLWSYDILKTEQWLTQMEEKGYKLRGLNCVTRCFLFEQAEPKRATYRISYDKLRNKILPSTLQKEGWTNVIQTGNWSIIGNEDPPEQIKTSPVRDGIMRRNRIIQYMCTFMVFFMAGILLNPIIVFLTDGGTIVESPLWVFTYIFFSIVFLLGILGVTSVFKIMKSNKQFLNEMQTGQIKEQVEDKQGPVVRKWKFGWMYAPDKLEAWLEEMEESGLQLYRVGKAGVTFYFIKATPRKMAYSIDYQNLSNESYFTIHQDSGWKKVYSSPSPLQKWTIWGGEYQAGEEKPQMYSDKTHLIKHAKKVALSYTFLFLPILVIYTLFIAAMITELIHNRTSSLNITNTILYFFLILTFGSYTLRIWLYYRRLKKRTELRV